MKQLKCFASGILSGVFIAIGGFAFVASMVAEPSMGIGKIIGSLLFSIGLLSVCFFGTNLYTGKIGFVLDNKASFILDLVLMLIGNLIGACLIGVIAHYAFIGSDAFQNMFSSVAQGRLVGVNEEWYEALLKSFLCGMLVFLAVYFYKKFENIFVKVVGIIFSVTVFVVCGFEHCIANMFYFASALEFSLGMLFNILLTILGNSIGAILLYLLFKLVFMEKKEG